MDKEDDIILTWEDLRRWFLISTAAGILGGLTIDRLSRPPDLEASPAVLARTAPAARGPFNGAG